MTQSACESRSSLRVGIAWPGRLAALPSMVVALWGAMVLRWVLTDTVIPWDSKNQFYAFFRFLGDSLHAGTTVFWNPYQYGGVPSIADPQSLIFSPLFLLWAWIDPSSSLRAFDILVMLHLLAGGLAMAAIGRRRGWPDACSLLAAAIFMLGGAASGRLNHSCIIVCYGLFPVALLSLEICLERKSAIAAISFVLTTAVIVLGRNQVALLLTILLLAQGIRLCAQSETPHRLSNNRWKLLVGMAVAIVLISSIPVLLTLQLAAYSNRPHVALAEALTGSLHPSNLATLAVANVFGTHSPAIGYWGPQYSLIPKVAGTDESFNYMFVGVVPVVLVLWHGIAGGRLMSRGARFMTAVGALALLFALGRYTPVFGFLFEHVPGIAFFRRPIDATFIVVIAIAFLSGELLARYVADGSPRLDPLAASAVASIVLAVAGSVIEVSALTNHVAASGLACLPALALLALCVAALVMGDGAKMRLYAAAAVTLIAVGELFFWNAASLLNAEGRSFYAVLEKSSPEDVGALRLLMSEIDRRHKDGARPRVEIVGLPGPWQNLAVIRKIEATTGYNPLRIGIYDRYVSPTEQGWVTASRKFPGSFKGYDSALARALGLEYVVLDRPIEQLKQQSKPTRLEVLLAGPNIWIYRIPNSLPRVHFSSRVELANSDMTTRGGELLHLPQPDRILIDAETPPAGRYYFPGQRYSIDRTSAVLKSWHPGTVEIDVDAPRAGIVVLHDLYYPGWTARVDGRRVPVLRADILFRAAEVPAGRHNVEFRFEPLTLENLWAAARQLAGLSLKRPSALSPPT